MKTPRQDKNKQSAKKRSTGKTAEPNAKKAPAGKAAKKTTGKKAASKKSSVRKAATAPPPSPAERPFATMAAAESLAADRPLIQKMGPLLRSAMSGIIRENQPRGVARLALDFAPPGGQTEPEVPLAISLPRIAPQRGENWQTYKQRVQDIMGPVGEWLKANAGLEAQHSITAASFACRAVSGQMEEAARHQQVTLLEMDAPRKAILMDDAGGDLELPLFLSRNTGLDGSGIRVAVLDSGIDLKHPWLQVADSIETCGESVEIPGTHGTHVAGSIASRDEIYRGIAPQVTLLNVKVLDHTGNGTASSITRGIDAALDMNADILSLSVGFNHLPSWSWNGHGHVCHAGDCVLCTAVNNAVLLDHVFVVVAAGNERLKAEALRNRGRGDSFDSEISCPGSAAGALTVGAITKRTFLAADFSSRGPASSGLAKPDIAAPGVNIRSANVVRRDPRGVPVPGLTRAELGRSESGTSMATPIVSGAAALLLQRRRARGEDDSPAALRAELLGNATQPLGAPATEVGVGRLNLSGL